MSNSLAIAAVTTTIRYLIETELCRPPLGTVGGEKVYTLRPDRFAAGDYAGVNLFLYGVSPNAAWTVDNLPTRGENGVLLRDPTAALDLQYLITCHGEKATAEIDGQRLLGRVVMALGANPILARDIIRKAMQKYEQELDFLGHVDLAEQIELVRLSRVVLTAEELSKLWSLFYQTPYEITVFYTASVVLIESDRDVHQALPVRERMIDLAQRRAPHITSVRLGPEPANLSIKGTNLLDVQTRVRVGTATLQPSPGTDNSELQIALGPNVPVGIFPVQVCHLSEPPRESNTMTLTVPPVIKQTTVTPESVTLTVHRPLRSGQRAVVQLSRTPGATPAPGQPDTRTFRQPPVPPDSAPQATIVLDRNHVPDGQWLVRLEIDGVQSELDVVGEVYDHPTITVPPA